MADTKFRLITRSDFDGLVCAVLLKHLELIDDIKTPQRSQLEMLAELDDIREKEAELIRKVTYDINKDKIKKRKIQMMPGFLFLPSILQKVLSMILFLLQGAKRGFSLTGAPLKQEMQHFMKKDV